MYQDSVSLIILLFFYYFLLIFVDRRNFTWYATKPTFTELYLMRQHSIFIHKTMSEEIPSNCIINKTKTDPPIKTVAKKEKEEWTRKFVQSIS